MKLTSIELRKAAEIQEKIEKLQADLDVLLKNNSPNETPAATVPEPVAEPEPSVRRRPRRRATLVVPMNGSRGRKSTSPTGPLAPAVVKVLESKGSPMSVPEILDGLLSSGYKFNSSEPKKNLFARIYRLKGVKQAGPGRFAVE